MNNLKDLRKACAAIYDDSLFPNVPDTGIINETSEVQPFVPRGEPYIKEAILSIERMEEIQSRMLKQISAISEILCRAAISGGIIILKDSGDFSYISMGGVKRDVTINAFNEISEFNEGHANFAIERIRSKANEDIAGVNVPGYALEESYGSEARPVPIETVKKKSKHSYKEVQKRNKFFNKRKA